MKNVWIILLAAICFSSCDINYCYSVYVKNSTGEPLTISYKSPNDSKGVVEETITLAPGEENGTFKMIIRTRDMEKVPADMGDAPKVCEFVAEYFKVSIRNNIESKVKWCDPSIKFETEDIGEAAYRLEYQLSNFPVEE